MINRANYSPKYASRNQRLFQKLQLGNAKKFIASLEIECESEHKCKKQQLEVSKN